MSKTSKTSTSSSTKTNNKSTTSRSRPLVPKAGYTKSGKRSY